MLNASFAYRDGALYCDSVPLSDIAAATGTPTYVYSLRRALQNLHRVQTAFADLRPHIHYSAKANANLAVLRALITTGAGIDAVSAGEIHRALLAGTPPEQIVFAGVGKTRAELAYALDQQVGWFNVENVAELDLLNTLAAEKNLPTVRIALRLNPDVTADTHPYIATGHGGAKFGLSADVIRDVLANRRAYPHLQIAGIHVHIGSQLGDTAATVGAVEAALDLIAPYPDIRSVNVGGGLPVPYTADDHAPAWEDFAARLIPLLRGYDVLLEPGRAIIADAGALLISVLYVKEQGGQHFLITDGSMAELIRPALYQARHTIVPLSLENASTSDLNSVLSPQHSALSFDLVGPVCETADALGRAVPLPVMQPGDYLAVLNTGAYGMVMSSNYNQRLRPPEVVVSEDGTSWSVARRRETWDDLVRHEIG